MAAKIKVKCKYCGKEVIRDEAYNPFPKQYYCNEDCYNARERKRLGEEEAKARDKIKYKPIDNGNPRRRFTDYLQDMYVYKYGWNKDAICWEMLCATASNYLKQYEDWSYESMTYVLYYMNEVLELDLVNQDSNYNALALLPFYYREAKEYCENTMDIESKIESFDFNDEKVVVKTSDRKKKFKLLNFD